MDPTASDFSKDRALSLVSATPPGYPRRRGQWRQHSSRCRPVVDGRRPGPGAGPGRGAGGARAGHAADVVRSRLRRTWACGAATGAPPPSPTTSWWIAPAPPGGARAPAASSRASTPSASSCCGLRATCRPRCARPPPRRSWPPGAPRPRRPRRVHPSTRHHLPRRHRRAHRGVRARRRAGEARIAGRTSGRPACAPVWTSSIGGWWTTSGGA